MKLSCINIDDESLGRAIVQDYIGQIPFLNYLGSGKNAIEAIEKIDKLRPDLVFLDIQMPGLLGTKILENLSYKPMVVFVTAYEQYAVESYDLDVVDYIMKPVSFERFSKAAQKAFDRFNVVQNSNHEPVVDHIFVNVEYALVKINFDTISHIQGLKDYIKIFVNTQVHPILTKSTLKGIEEKLPADKFLRVQKSFIINLEKIEKIRNHKIQIGKFEIPISENYMPNFLTSINK
jgi:two-component system, LytTR family, response regulator